MLEAARSENGDIAYEESGALRQGAKVRSSSRDPLALCFLLYGFFSCGHAWLICKAFFAHEESASLRQGANVRLASRVPFGLFFLPFFLG